MHGVKIDIGAITAKFRDWILLAITGKNSMKIEKSGNNDCDKYTKHSGSRCIDNFCISNRCRKIANAEGDN